MTQPPSIIAALGLAFDSNTELGPGDGTPHNFEVCAAEVLRDGVWRPVLATAIGDEVLVGMQLLARHRFEMDVIPGGAVEIAPLP